MALDLGNRLLPAFDSATSIPYGTVDLVGGVPEGETSEACTAAAGSLSLEFGMLSVLTKDARFARASREALRRLYELRSPNFNLFGRHLDVKSGAWTESLAGIGSNIDSVYECELGGDCYSLELAGLWWGQRVKVALSLHVGAEYTGRKPRLHLAF